MGRQSEVPKFRVVPYEFFSLLFSLDVLPVLQLLQVFCFEALLALSLTHVLHIATSLSLHLVPLPATVTATVCHLEALLALSNIHTLHSISSPRGSSVFLSPLWLSPCFSLSFRLLLHRAPDCPSFGHIPPLFSGLHQPTVDCHPLYGTHGTTSRGALSETCSLCMVQNKWETYPRLVKFKISNNWDTLGICPHTRLWHTIQVRIINTLHFILILNFAFSVNVSIFLTLCIYCIHSRNLSLLQK
jgi:hypothetical protein